MNFSDIASFSGQSEFSPNSEYVASVKGLKLSIYESANMNMIHSWNIIDQVSKLVWSADSFLLMCSQNKRGLIQVFNIKEPKWDCKISLGPSGLSGSFISPDSRHTLTICQFQIRLNIWSLTSKSIISLPSPKFSNKGLTFSKCGSFTAVLLRNSGKDSIVILDNTFTVVVDFGLKGNDTENIIWTNDNYYIIAYENLNWFAYSPTGELIYEYSDTLISSSFNSISGLFGRFQFF